VLSATTVAGETLAAPNSETLDESTVRVLLLSNQWVLLLSTERVLLLLLSTQWVLLLVLLSTEWVLLLPTGWVLLLPTEQLSLSQPPLRPTRSSLPPGLAALGQRVQLLWVRLGVPLEPRSHWCCCVLLLLLLRSHWCCCVLLLLLLRSHWCCCVLLLRSHWCCCELLHHIRLCTLLRTRMCIRRCARLVLVLLRPSCGSRPWKLLQLVVAVLSTRVLLQL
jgi:hypothetical protein